MPLLDKEQTATSRTLGTTTTTSTSKANMSVAQRRGKVGLEKASTVLVSNIDNGADAMSHMETAVPSGTADAPAVARVQRNFCGTGPFDKHWLNLDCCGLFCALMTYGLHVYGVYAVCLVLLPPWMSHTDEATKIRTTSLAGWLHKICFTLIAFLAVYSHFKAMTTDPGAVPPDAKPIEEETTEAELNSSEHKSLLDPPRLNSVKRICRRCRSHKPTRAHHCSVCKRCIIKMDHHCPWVNNCVGIGNHKYFLLFVFYTFLSCVYSLSLVITRFSTCGLSSGSHRRGHHRHDVADTQHRMEVDQRHHRHHVTCMDQPTQLLTILGLLVEGVLFGMFTSCMLFDQSTVVASKLTHIDRFKGADAGGGLPGVLEVFGVGKRGKSGSDTRFRLDWLSPFVRVCFPSSLTDEILGYCRPCRRFSQSKKDDTQTDEAKGTIAMAEII